MTENRTKLPAWEFVFIVFCTIYFVVPEAQLFIPFFYTLFIELAYVLFMCATHKLKPSVSLGFIFGICLVALLYVVLNDSNSVGHDVANRSIKRFLSKSWQYSCMFFPMALLTRCIRNASQKQKYIILTTTLICAFLSIRNILNLIAINPLAARNFGYEKDVAEIDNFIAPYPFVYGMTFFALLFYVLWRRFFSNEKLLKSASFFLFIFFSYFLIKSQFTLSLITTFISIMYMHYRGAKDRNQKLLVVLLAVIILVLMPLLLDFLISVSPNMLAVRFSEMRDFLVGKSSSGNDSDLMGRITLYKKTIAAFLHSPIYGNRTLDFYGHATFLTVWADLGVLGGIPLFTLFFKAKKSVTNILGNNSYLFIPFFFHIMIMGLTNPIHASLPIDILLWFIVPLSINIFSNKLIIK